MTDAEKLEKIRQIYDPQTRHEDGSFESGHIRHNLLGAAIDLERLEQIDPICKNTIERVMHQLAEIETVLGI